VIEPRVTSLRCAACGEEPPATEPWPFRCSAAGAGDDVDHVLTRNLDPARVRLPFGDDPNPFVRFRDLLHSHARALAGGLTDDDFVAMVRGLDGAIERVDGRGFVTTPFSPSAPLAAALSLEAGSVWLKDETVNVSGSHKARHLMGLALHLEVAEQLGLVTRAETDARGLAIASCGNAALAAAVVARASSRPLRVFIPTDAAPGVVARLHDLGARIEVCPRDPATPGDPCVHAFHRALRDGAIPFCVQGNENGLTIEGGQTIGWEIAWALRSEGVTLDRLFVQVGGGALASACIQALREAVALGVIERLPRLHAVQTEGAWPLRRAYERVRDRSAATSNVREALDFARDHRSQFMWPWETAPHSVAHGILDDETYDWHAVVAGMLETGGSPVTVAEETLVRARDSVREATGIRADATGAAGLAGLIALREVGEVRGDERVAVLITGAER
jgi:threonine synthase